MSMTNEEIKKLNDELLKHMQDEGDLSARIFCKAVVEYMRAQMYPKPGDNKDSNETSDTSEKQNGSRPCVDS